MRTRGILISRQILKVLDPVAAHSHEKKHKHGKPVKVIVGGNLRIKKAQKIFLLNCPLLLMRINADKKKVGYIVFRQCRFGFSVLPTENDLGTAEEYHKIYIPTCFLWRNLFYIRLF